jgi:hypothetical protein
LLDRIARQYRHLMSDASDKKEKLRLGYASLEYAKEGAALAPNNAEAQLSPAISYGKMMPYMSSGEQVDASPRIKAAVDRALDSTRLTTMPGTSRPVESRARGHRPGKAHAGRSDLRAVTGGRRTKRREMPQKGDRDQPESLIITSSSVTFTCKWGASEEARKYIEKGYRCQTGKRTTRR